MGVRFIVAVGGRPRQSSVCTACYNLTAMIGRLSAIFWLVQMALLPACAASAEGVRVEKRITVTNQMVGLADASLAAAVWGVAFSPNQQRLAAGVRYGKKGDKPPYYDKSYILVFDIGSPERNVRKIELSRPRAINVYPELFWSSDGRYLATAFYGDWSHAAIVDLSTNAVHSLPSQNCRVKGILAGPQLALTCFDGHVRLLAADGTATRELNSPGRASILNVDSLLGQIAVLFSKREDVNPPQQERDIAIINAGDLKEIRRWSLPPGEDSYFGTFVKAGAAF